MQARTEDVIVQDLGDECIVYDTRTRKAHSLNASLKWIWEQCDGTRSAEDIADGYGRTFGGDDASGDVRAGLRQLVRANLLSGDVPNWASAAGDVSRRKVMAAASLAVPLLTSVLVPPAAAAKSKDNGNNGNGNAYGQSNGKGNNG